MDVRGLLTNRWFLGAVGVAGAAGAYTLIKRRKSGAAGSTSQSGGGQSNPAYASGSVGSFDSTGTDVANWLGQYSGNLDNQFKEFQRSVADQLAAIPAGTTGTGTTGTANNPSPAAVPASLLVPAGVNLYGWAQDIEARYGVSSAVFDQIRSQGHVSFVGAYVPGVGQTPVFDTPTTVTVR